MNRRERIERELELLEELDVLDESSLVTEAEEGSSSLDAIRDFYLPKIRKGFYGDLSHLRRAVWPFGKR